MGWMRVCRPGSVIGPQQQYMVEAEARMWREGAAFRTGSSRRALIRATPGASDAFFSL